MAEKKKGKKRKEEYVPPGEEQVVKPSKDEYSIAKWLRKNVPIKQTKFLNHNVKYFTASRAIDGLLTSKWSQGETALFKSREDVVDFLHVMLEHKFYHRARKVPVSEHELKGGSVGKKKEKDKEKEKEKKGAIEDEKKKLVADEKKTTDAESSVVEGKPEVNVEKEKRKRKIRLDMHNDQRFVDGMDAYVWIYDPIPFYYWIFGTLLVLGAIGLCLFPLWPPSVRLGVYYLSVAAAGFLVFIILLVVLRLIVFCFVWMATMGKHHVWILPNLTEDVGFFASFWPLYKYEYKGGDSNNSKKSKKKKKDKDSDAEDNDVKDDETKKLLELPENKDGATEENTAEIERLTEGNNQQSADVQNASESESESSQRSSTGKDFEMVDEGDIIDS